MKSCTLALVLCGAATGVLSAQSQVAQESGPAPKWETRSPAPPTADDPVGWNNVARPGGKLPGNPSIALVRVADGFNDPTAVASARDGSGRLFVAERAGRIKVVAADGKVLPEPFLDLTGKALPLGGDVQHQFLEQGLYSIAFHPNFKQNGYFYVHYASLPFGGDGFIVRFTTSKDVNKADPESAKVIMHLERPYYNHNGGMIAFGPDGYLYIGSGDGGWEGDPLNAGQDLSTTLGKMLRIDVNTENAQGYVIPATNPLVSKPQLMALFGVTDDDFYKIKKNHRPEIWAWGVRNPWTFQFDTKTGDLYVADVGQSEMEPIYFQPASSKGGENYGWNYRMGTKCFPKGSTACPQIGVPPAGEYDHSQGCAIMGFGVDRSNYAALNGTYLVGDWCSGKVFGLGRNSDGKWIMQDLATTGLNFTGGNVGEDGTAYAVNCTCFYTTDKGADNNPPGSLWKIVDASKVSSGAVLAPNKNK